MPITIEVANGTVPVAMAICIVAAILTLICIMVTISAVLQARAHALDIAGRFAKEMRLHMHHPDGVIFNDKGGPPYYILLPYHYAMAIFQPRAVHLIDLCFRAPDGIPAQARALYKNSVVQDEYGNWHAYFDEERRCEAVQFAALLIADG